MCRFRSVLPFDICVRCPRTSGPSHLAWRKIGSKGKRYRDTCAIILATLAIDVISLAQPNCGIALSCLHVFKCPQSFSVCVPFLPGACYLSRSVWWFEVVDPLPRITESALMYDPRLKFPDFPTIIVAAPAICLETGAMDRYCRGEKDELTAYGETVPGLEGGYKEC